MAEYIEREALIKRLEASPLIQNYLIMRGSQNLINGILDLIKRQPTADVVEVVRCKDCKRYKTDSYYCQKTKQGYCELDNNVKQKQGYCSYGERRCEE